MADIGALRSVDPSGSVPVDYQIRLATRLELIAA
jgi:hypothetical protein